ncbi:TetR/AcrR family transcriptional regulator, partial [Rhizobium leguminosarum]
DLQMMILLGGTPTYEELEKAARNAVHTFLKAYGSTEAEKAGHPAQLAAISG